jgi:hypothetical protein
VVLCFAVAAVAQKPSPPQPGGDTIPLERIPRVTKPPKLEDFLENKPREAELAVNDFRQNVPGDGTQATEKTTAYLSYDDRNLYVVFVCRDDGQVRAHLSKREDVVLQDGVGVLLDTFRDHHRARIRPLRFSTKAVLRTATISCSSQKSAIFFVFESFVAENLRATLVRDARHRIHFLFLRSAHESCKE